MTFVVTTSSGKSVSYPVTINLNQVNLPPYFNAPSYFYSASEGLPSGTELNPPLQAIDVNVNNVVSYAVIGCTPTIFNPATGARICPFTVDQSLGSVKISQQVPGGVLMADLNSTFPVFGPFTYALNVSAFNNGVPVMRAVVPVSITIVNIVPRWRPGASFAVTVNNSLQSAGSVALNLQPLVWTPYDSSIFSNNFSAYRFGAPTFRSPTNAFDGRTAFDLNSNTGVLAISASAPQFNISTQPGTAAEPSAPAKPSTLPAVPPAPMGTVSVAPSSLARNMARA
jgi:hypothetical protein